MSSLTVIGSGKDSVGLGDILLLTPICRQADCVVQLPPRAERFACLFDDLAEVRIVDNPVNLSNVGDDHYAKCKLRGLGLDENDYIPDLMRRWSRQANGNIIFKTTCSHKWQKLRGLPDVVVDGIKGAGIRHLVNADTMLECTIDEKISWYQQSLRYIGCDTGDYHLMLALGGKCIVLVPDNCEQYEYRRWHYIDYPGRVKYVNFKDWETVNADFVTNFFR